MTYIKKQETSGHDMTSHRNKKYDVHKDFGRKALQEATMWKGG